MSGPATYYTPSKVSISPRTSHNETPASVTNPVIIPGRNGWVAMATPQAIAQPTASNVPHVDVAHNPANGPAKMDPHNSMACDGMQVEIVPAKTKPMAIAGQRTFTREWSDLSDCSEQFASVGITSAP